MHQYFIQITQLREDHHNALPCWKRRLHPSQEHKSQLLRVVINSNTAQLRVRVQLAALLLFDLIVDGDTAEFGVGV